MTEKLETYTTTTNSIKVTVVPKFKEDLSLPEKGNYIWEYSIILENCGDRTITLLTRNWTIFDSNGIKKEVQGIGVAGQQPVLRPGKVFHYKSHANLQAPSGLMLGSYKMCSDNQEEFEVTIPAFSLDSPNEIKIIN